MNPRSAHFAVLSVLTQVFRGSQTLPSAVALRHLGILCIGQVVELAAHRPQARLNIAQTLAICELPESHRQILVPARQAPVTTVAVVTGHALLELAVGKMGNQLREDGSAGIHPPLFREQRCRPILTDPARFQFKSFFGGTPSKNFISRRLSANAKYFTGHQ